MSKTKLLEAVVWTCAVGSVLGSVRAWTRSVPGIHPEAGFAVQPVEPSRPIDSGTIHRAATILRDRNPFRIERRPTLVRFGTPDAEPAPELAETPVEHPDLMLAGIVGGPPWIVLVEGIPGRESGVVLIEGAEMNGFRLEGVRGDTVILIGLDTTWVLLPKRVWR